MRLGLRVSVKEPLHVLGAGQHGFGGRDTSGGGFLPRRFAACRTKA